MWQVLIIEDTALHGSPAADELEALGCRVMQACTPAQALTMAAIQPPDLVLLNAALPEAVAAEAVRGFRAASRGSGVPIGTVASDGEHCSVMALTEGDNLGGGSLLLAQALLSWLGVLTLQRNAEKLEERTSQSQWQSDAMPL